MNETHLNALLAAVERAPTAEYAQALREIAAIAFNAMQFAKQLEFEQRMAESATPVPTDLPASAEPELSIDECARRLDVLVRLGIDAAMHHGKIEALPQLIEFYEHAVDHAITGMTPDARVPSFTQDEEAIVLEAFDALRTERINDGATVGEIEAIYIVEDKCLDLIGG